MSSKKALEFAGLLTVAIGAAVLGAAAWDLFMLRRSEPPRYFESSKDHQSIIVGMIWNYACLEMLDDILRNSRDKKYNDEDKIQVMTKNGAVIDVETPLHEESIVFGSKMHGLGEICGSYQLNTNGLTAATIEQQRKALDKERQVWESVGKALGNTFGPDGGTDQIHRLAPEAIRRLVTQYKDVAGSEATSFVKVKSPDALSALYPPAPKTNDFAKLSVALSHLDLWLKLYRFKPITP